MLGQITNDKNFEYSCMVEVSWQTSFDDNFWLGKSIFITITCPNDPHMPMVIL